MQCLVQFMGKYHFQPGMMMMMHIVFPSAVVDHIL